MSFSGEDFHDMEERPEWRQTAPWPKSWPTAAVELRVITESAKELAGRRGPTADKNPDRANSVLTERMATVRRRCCGTRPAGGQISGQRPGLLRAGGAAFAGAVVGPSGRNGPGQRPPVRRRSSGTVRNGCGGARQKSGGRHGCLPGRRVSWGVGRHDVERAVKRAELWSRLGTPAIPVVAGRWVTHEAEHLCRSHPVWQLTNGRAVPPSKSTGLN